MKKIFLFVFSISLFAFVNVHAQLFEKFKAKEAYETALKNVKYTNPQLLFVGSVNGEFEAGIVKIASVFDFNSGKTELWVVMFNDKNEPDSTQTFAVVKSLMGVMALDISESDMLDFELDLTNPITDANWIDSDVMASELMKNGKFKEFVDKYPKPEVAVIGLFRNTIYEYLDLGKVFWGVQLIQGEEIQACGIEIETKQVICADYGSIDDFKNGNISVYPNPAVEHLNINYNNNVNVQNIELYDLNGNIIYISDYDSILSGKIKINVESLPIGTYMLNMQVDNRWGTIPIKVVK